MYTKTLHRSYWLMPSHFKLKSQSFVSTAIRISAFAMFHLLFIINKFPKISINLNIWHQKWLFFKRAKTKEM